MIKAKLLLENARIENVENIAILKGQSFRIELTGNTDNLEWFVSNDPILKYTEDIDHKAATFKATGEGESEIRLFKTGILNEDESRIEKRIYITVFTEMASSLGITFSDEEPK